MALRLIELVLPEEKKEQVKKILEEYSILDIWLESLTENLILIKIIPAEDETESILDLLEKHYSNIEGFRIILLPVEATIPRPKPTKEKGSVEEIPTEQESKAKAARISREELYTDITDATKLSSVYGVMVILSSVVAAIGILRENVAVIIGAMVIAPLLGPNVALSLATTLGDIDLARRAIKTNLIGIFTAFIISVILGFFLPVNPDISVIVSRAKVGVGDIILALAAGGAGALAFTTGISTVLIGVMVAVALLPPLVISGLLLGSGNWLMSIGAILLLLTNLICINLAGVITFLLQGIHPRTWWEADKAKKMTLRAVFLWILLLIVLAIIILLSQKS